MHSQPILRCIKRLFNKFAHKNQVIFSGKEI